MPISPRGARRPLPPGGNRRQGAGGVKSAVFGGEGSALGPLGNWIQGNS